MCKPNLLVVSVLLLSLLFGGKTFLDKSEPSSPASPSTPAGSSMHVIDVGQGDGILLKLGEEFVLIDAGPTDAGDTVVQYLKAQGVQKLRAVLATHPHEDHIGGMGKVLSAFPVESFYMPNKIANTRAFSRMLDGIEKQKLTPILPKVGETLTVGGATFTFLSPDPKKEYDNTNNYSLVTRLDVGDLRVMLAGDAEREIESALLKSKADVRCDIYKVSHHGSKTSSTPAFLEAMQPKVAVISCAKDNSYGHPDPRVMKRLEKIGATVYVTAQQGTVVLPLSP